LKKLAEDEAELLLRRLRNIEEEEAERVKKMRLVQLEHQVETEKLRKLRHAEMEAERYKLQQLHSYNDNSLLPEQFGPDSSNIDLHGISEEELDQQCDELFGEAPIVFKPRKDNEIDQMIASYIQETNITIPIIWIKKDLYLIGSTRLSCELKRDSLMLRVGGGYEKFEEYITKNLRYHQRILVIHMIKSGESLEWVVDALINGKKIRNVNQAIQQEASYLSKFRYSGLLDGSMYSPGGRKSSLTPTRGLSYTQRVRQIYRSPRSPIGKRNTMDFGLTVKRNSYVGGNIGSPYTGMYAGRKSSPFLNAKTAEVTPESLNYKTQKQEILQGLKDTFGKGMYSTRFVSETVATNEKLVQNTSTTKI